MSERILTTRFERSHPYWKARADLLPGWRTGFRSTVGGGVSSRAATFYWGWRLFRESARYRAVVTGSDSVSHIFAVLLTLSGRRVPYVMIECMWNVGHPLMRPLRRLHRRLETGVIARAVLYAERQRARFAATWGLPIRKVVAIPYRTTLDGFSLVPRDEGFIFAGGDQSRDYRTLIEATRHFTMPVVIAARRRDHFKGVRVPSHVTIVTTSQEEFARLTASARIVVVPLQRGLLFSGGHQTYLNAMALGKPTVVADDCGAEEYIEHGQTGFVVPAGDVEALRDALGSIIDDPGHARAIGERAKHVAAQYTAERFYDHIFRLVDEAVADETIEG